jgi:hypothetical protein
LTKRFERRPREVELLTPGDGEKWTIAVRLYLLDIFITAYKNGEVQIDVGPERTKSETWDYLDGKKYGRIYEARGEEDRLGLQAEEVRGLH